MTACPRHRLAKLELCCSLFIAGQTVVCGLTNVRYLHLLHRLKHLLQTHIHCSFALLHQEIHLTACINMPLHASVGQLLSSKTFPPVQTETQSLVRNTWGYLCTASLISKCTHTKKLINAFFHTALWFALCGCDNILRMPRSPSSSCSLPLAQLIK